MLSKQFEFTHLAARQAGWKVARVCDEWASSGFGMFSLPYTSKHPQLAERARQEGLYLLNSAAQTERAMRFSQFYPLVSDLTPQSQVIKDVAEVDLEFPLFVKGDIKSQKERGWSNCVAHNEKELTALLSESGAVIREVVKLRSSGDNPLGFPLAREYRVFLYQRSLLGMGPYWMSKDPFGSLKTSEENKILDIALTAQERVDVSLLCVDVAQREDGEWVMIEMGDPQFTPITQILPQTFFSRLTQIISW